MTYQKYFDNKIEKIIEKTSGKLIVKEYPTICKQQSHNGLIKELTIKVF